LKLYLCQTASTAIAVQAIERRKVRTAKSNVPPNRWYLQKCR